MNFSSFSFKINLSTSIAFCLVKSPFEKEFLKVNDKNIKEMEEESNFVHKN